VDRFAHWGILLVAFWPIPGLAAQAPAESSQPPTSRELIDGIQEFEGRLGIARTRNFDQNSETLQAYYRCYYTGPLELPESYERLKLKEGKESGCGMDPRRYDVFFYPIEAVASGKTPVTKSLAEAKPERVLVVVPHEDYHMRKDLPASVGEAAATLVGFLTAADYARQEFGENSQLYRNLAGEPELFLRKSALVNRTYEELSGIYSRMRKGKVRREEAFAAKGRLFAELRSGCQAISPSPRSFNKCLAAENNAGLAFDRTYTRFYPLLYELYESRGRNVRSTVAALDRILSARSLSENKAAARIREAIAETAANGSKAASAQTP
jgi:hypothetical protein